MILRRLLWPAIITAAMLVVLCGLGAWQLQRRDFKTALLARIDASEAAQAVALPAEPEPFQRVRVTGRLRPITGRYGVEVRSTARGEILGSQVVAVLDRGGDLPVVTLLGWFPADERFLPPADPVAFDAYVRRPERPGWFAPVDDFSRRQFYTLDPARIGAAMGAPAVAPFSVTRMAVQGEPAIPGAPAPATSLPRPPNDHLQYALTWFGLAATLVVVAVTYARKVVSA